MLEYNNKSVGIDIADRSIELVEVARSANKLMVSKWNRAVLEPGIINKGLIENEDKLAKIIIDLFAKAQPAAINNMSVVFGIPESHVFTHVFTTGKSDIDVLDEEVEQQAIMNIPLDQEDLLFAYRILRKENGRNVILIIATSKKFVNSWQNFFNKIGISVNIFDIETLATYRGLYGDNLPKSVCLVDIGAITTNISVYNKYGLQYSRSLRVAGSIITDQLAAKLNIPRAEAEEKKKSVGLSTKNEQAKEVFTESFDMIIREIKVTLNYVEKKYGEQISSVVLVGGTSKMKGLVSYFQNNLAAAVDVGKSYVFKTKVPLEYVEAVGLALRGLSGNWDNVAPAFIGEMLEEYELTSKSEIFLKHSRAKMRKLRRALPSIQDQAEKQKKILLLILLVGVFLCIVTLGYRDYQITKRQAELREIILQYKEALTKQLNELENKAVLKNGESDGSGDVDVSGGEFVSDVVDEGDVNGVQDTIIEEPAQTDESIDETATIDTGDETAVLDVQEDYIIIDENELGYLNVREDAGTGFPIVTQVNPGDEFLVLEESAGWYKIKIDDQTEGWVKENYVTKK